MRRKGSNSLFNMEKSVQQYKQAVRVIKDAILYSQYRAAKLLTIYKSRHYRYDIECFSLQKCSPMASEINREELRNTMPDMDEMRKLITENNE